MADDKAQTINRQLSFLAVSPWFCIHRDSTLHVFQKEKFPGLILTLRDANPVIWFLGCQIPTNKNSSAGFQREAGKKMEVEGSPNDLLEGGT